MDQKFDTERDLVMARSQIPSHLLTMRLQSDSEGGSINICRAFEEWQENAFRKASTGHQTGIYTG